MATKCPSCEYEHDNLVSLSIHFRKKHKGTSKQLSVMLNHGGIEPTCACGCTEPVKFHSIQRGFSLYTWGHAARVNNNWGHNVDAQKKSQDKRRQQITAGKWRPWNIGLSADSDKRVEANNVAISQSILSKPEECHKRSKRLQKGRLDGTVQTLFGKDHSQWKGGVSSVQALSRSYVFNVWTYHKLHASGFTCQKCGVQSDLEVHHDKERFAEILQKARVALGDVTDDFASHQAYAKWIADYHVQNDVSGIVLCEGCHQKTHVSEQLVALGAKIVPDDVASVSPDTDDEVVLEELAKRLGGSHPEVIASAQLLRIAR